VRLSPVASAVAARHAGSVVLLDVWATWCTNCVEGLQDLARLQRELGPRGLRVVAINVDQGLDSAAVRAWLARHAIDLAFVLDPSGASAAMLPQPGIPQSVVLDHRGEVRDFRMGHSPPGSGSSWLDQLARQTLDSALARPHPSRSSV
jgi:thiol-disulfide isomerase/thioredoxin